MIGCVDISSTVMIKLSTEENDYNHSKLNYSSMQQQHTQHIRQKSLDILFYKIDGYKKIFLTFYCQK